MTSYLSQYGISNLLEAYKKYGGDLTDLVGYAQYTTFGQVIEGLDIVDKIAAVSTNSSNKPIEDVIISNIEITTYTK
jgi:cyclophilin family peptidyl-prolyl cis-trans isomerase